MMNHRGYGLTALVWLGALAAGCGGYVDLENPPSEGGASGSGAASPSAGEPATAGSGGSGGVSQGTAGEPGDAGEPSVPNGAGGDDSSDGGAPSEVVFVALTSPEPQFIPAGADGPGVTWTGTAVIDTGNLEGGALAGANEYCFKKPATTFSCDWQTREPFVWTDASGMVPLDRLNVEGDAFYAQHVTADGSVVVGSYGEQQAMKGFFRWTQADGGSSLGEPESTISGAPWFMSEDGGAVAGIAKATDKGKLEGGQFLWTEADGYLALAGSATWPEGAEVVGLSADGETVIGQTTGTAPHTVFRWTVADGVDELGSLPDADDCFVDQVAAGGDAIFGRCQDETQQGRAFRWTEPTGLVELQSNDCSLVAVMKASRDGTAAYGTVRCGADPIDFGRWSATSGTVEIATSSGFRVPPHSVGTIDDGSVAFGVLLSSGSPFLQDGANGSRAFRFTTSAGLALLPTLPSHGFSSAYAADENGAAVVGRSGVENGASKAVLWSDGLALDIAAYVVSKGVDLNGLELQSAERVARRGDAVLVQGIANQQSRGGVWFAKIAD